MSDSVEAGTPVYRRVPVSIEIVGGETPIFKRCMSLKLGGQVDVTMISLTIDADTPEPKAALCISCDQGVLMYSYHVTGIHVRGGGGGNLVGLTQAIRFAASEPAALRAGGVALDFSASTLVTRCVELTMHLEFQPDTVVGGIPLRYLNMVLNGSRPLRRLVDERLALVQVNPRAATKRVYEFVSQPAVAGGRARLSMSPFHVHRS